MANIKETKWIYTKKNLEQSPSRKDGISAEKELSYRQQAANLIQDMGQRLTVNQLTINTAIVYMHRFYYFHSFTVFSRYAIAPTALFLAAKVEEQPKKLEHVLKICHQCLHPDKQQLDTHSEPFLKQAQELVQNELVLLQTLGFDISVDHPHTHVVKCTQLVKASRDLSQMAYFMATNSLHLTTFCLLYKPTIVAAMCIHLSCKWSNYEIPLSSDGKAYWSYMDPSITEPLLETIINEFLKILTGCPTRLKKLKNYRHSQSTKPEVEGKEETRQSGQQHHEEPPKPATFVPVKEKKPAMSLEEYKRTHPPKPSHPSHLSAAEGSSSHAGQIKKPAPHGSVPRSNDNNRASYSHSHPHESKFSRPIELTAKQAHTHFQSKQLKAAQYQLPTTTTVNEMQRSKKYQSDHMSKNMMNRPQPNPRGHANTHHHASNFNGAQSFLKTVGEASQKQTIADNDNAPVGIVAVSKDLEGRIQSEKLFQKIKSDSAEHQKSGAHVASVPGVSHSNHGPSSGTNELHRRHPMHQSGKLHDVQTRQPHVNKDKNQVDYKKMVEMYKKCPDKLKSYLKHKKHNGSLNAQEKNLYHQLQVKEEERRKRKAAESQANKQHPDKTNSPIASVDSPSGPLTIRIKLGAKPTDGESGVKTSVAKIVPSSSGSGTDSPVRPRKRGHGEAGERSAAKHQRRSDHRHERSHLSGSDANTGGSKHKHQQRDKYHSQSSTKHGETIDEDVFQKSLSDALTQVQQAGASTIPTVTLKRASHGKDSSALASIRHQEYLISGPVSTQVPDDILEHESNSSTFTGSGMSRFGSLVAYDSSQSTPEPGEINDESPPYAKARSKYSQDNFISSKGTSIFSPP